MNLLKEAIVLLAAASAVKTFGQGSSVENLRGISVLTNLNNFTNTTLNNATLGNVTQNNVTNWANLTSANTTNTTNTSWVNITDDMITDDIIFNNSTNTTNSTPTDDTPSDDNDNSSNNDDTLYYWNSMQSWGESHKRFGFLALAGAVLLACGCAGVCACKKCGKKDEHKAVERDDDEPAFFQSL